MAAAPSDCIPLSGRTGLSTGLSLPLERWPANWGTDRTVKLKLLSEIYANSLTGGMLSGAFSMPRDDWMSSSWWLVTAVILIGRRTRSDMKTVFCSLICCDWQWWYMVTMVTFLVKRILEVKLLNCLCYPPLQGVSSLGTGFRVAAINTLAIKSSDDKDIKLMLH